MQKMIWAFQELIRRTLRKMGVEISRYHKEKGEYIPCFPYAYRTYAPWRQKEFLKKYAQISDRTMVREDRAYILCCLARHCLHLDGDFAECGVYRGASAYLISQEITETQKDQRAFHLWDTFAGMPSDSNEDPCGYSPGDYGDTSLKEVKNFLRDFSFIQYHPGIIPSTFMDVTEKKFAFVHVDVDLYKSVWECCVFFYERMAVGGVMVFDDYGFQQCELSARKAVDEFFRDKKERPITLHTGQCFVIKI